MIGSFVLSEGGCSVVVVTFMSRDFWNHVLCRVRHLLNRFVVFLESRVFLRNYSLVINICHEECIVTHHATP